MLYCHSDLHKCNIFDNWLHLVYGRTFRTRQVLEFKYLFFCIQHHMTIKRISLLAHILDDRKAGICLAV